MAQLDYEEPNDDVIYLLEYFWSLRNSSGGAISYTEIQAYSGLMHLNLSGWEVRVIMELNSIMERSING